MAMVAVGASDGGLDERETGLIQRLQQELKDRTFLLITHRPPLLALVTRIMLIDRGKVIANGPRDEVLKQITRQQPGPGPGPGTGVAPRAA